MKLVIYTLVGSLLMLTAAVATGVLAADRRGRASRSRSRTSPQRTLGASTQNWLFLAFAAAFLVKMPAFPFHGWMPDGYRAMPLPVLARLLGGAEQGRRLRLPAHLPAVLPRRQRALPDAHAADRAGLDPLRLGDGVHDDARAADPRLLVGRPARLHRARDLRAELAGRAGRDPAGVQPRPRRRAGVLHRRAARRALGRLARTSATWAASRCARRCSRRCSSS